MASCNICDVIIVLPFFSIKRLCFGVIRAWFLISHAYCTSACAVPSFPFGGIAGGICEEHTLQALAGAYRGCGAARGAVRSVGSEGELEHWAAGAEMPHLGTTIYRRWRSRA